MRELDFLLGRGSQPWLVFHTRQQRSQSGRPPCLGSFGFHRTVTVSSWFKPKRRTDCTEQDASWHQGHRSSDHQRRLDLGPGGPQGPRTTGDYFPLPFFANWPCRPLRVEKMEDGHPPAQVHDCASYYMGSMSTRGQVSQELAQLGQVSAHGWADYAWGIWSHDGCVT